MANYYGACRSNYFKVKDRKAFEAALDGYAWEIEYMDREDPKSKLVLCGTSGGGTPTIRRTPEDELAKLQEEAARLGTDAPDDLQEIDYRELFMTHLQDGEVAILMETGAEKLRYLIGSASAYHSDGRHTFVDLAEIYGKVETEFGVEGVSRCEY